MHNFVEQFEFDFWFADKFLGNVLVFGLIQMLDNTWLVVKFDKVL